MLFVFHREIYMVWSDEQWCFDGRSWLGPRFAASQSCQPFCIGNSTNVHELSSWPVHVSGKAMLSASQWWVSGQAALRDAENDDINKTYVLKGFISWQLAWQSISKILQFIVRYLVVMFEAFNFIASRISETKHSSVVPHRFVVLRDFEKEKSFSVCRTFAKKGSLRKYEALRKD